MIFANSIEIGAPGFQILFWIVLTAGILLAIARAYGRIRTEILDPKSAIEREKHEQEMRDKNVQRAGSVAGSLIGFVSKFKKK